MMRLSAAATLPWDGSPRKLILDLENIIAIYLPDEKSPWPSTRCTTRMMQKKKNGRFTTILD